MAASFPGLSQLQVLISYKKLDSDKGPGSETRGEENRSHLETPQVAMWETTNEHAFHWGNHSTHTLVHQSIEDKPPFCYLWRRSAWVAAVEELGSAPTMHATEPITNALWQCNLYIAVQLHFKLLWPYTNTHSSENSGGPGGNTIPESWYFGWRGWNSAWLHSARLNSFRTPSRASWKLPRRWSCIVGSNRLWIDLSTSVSDERLYILSN